MELFDASSQNLLETAKYSREYCSTAFQKFAFGEYRNRIEPDTRRESDVFKILYAFVENNVGQERLSNALELIQGCKQYYQEFQPDVRVAWRNTAIAWKHCPPIEDFVPATDFFAAPYLYKPKGLIQSFTTDENFAAQQGAIITLECRVDDDFIMSAEFMNQISSDAVAEDESEIIRLSNQPIQTRMLLNRRQYDAYNSWLESKR